jgi:alkanesulfonate monooxygenase SsuD/methylene tetrahydromethanopterin reductase-like flavin-dependent oxidoreductase (luciferase family)
MAHPCDCADHYNTLGYWVELVRILERGKFDALFLADVLGIYDVNRGSPDAAIANAVQVPVNDPLLLIPAMAYVTRNLGLALHARSRTNTPTRWHGDFRRSIT